MNTAIHEVPDAFQRIFASLVRALQPRGLPPDIVAVYWGVLHRLPMEAIRQSAAGLEQSRFWPNTGDWFEAAAAVHVRPALIPGSRRLEELDDLAQNDPERDAICKNLSPADEQALMARYGYAWPPS